MDTSGQQGTGLVPPEVALSMSGLDFLRGLLDSSLVAPHFSATAAVRPIAIEEGRVVFEGQPMAQFYNPMGTVHGGWMAILLDTAMACAVHSALKPGQTLTTLEMKTSFLRPVNENTGALRCEGVLLHLGGRIASSEGKVYDAEGNLVAHGSETCLIINPGRRDRSPAPG
jgi:uncharacterized protein (TIGR00369 family)